MNNMVDKGVSHSALLSDNEASVSEFAFSVEIKLNNPVDFYRDVAKTYLDMFGVTRNDEVFKSFSLFWNQYVEGDADVLARTEAYFRSQPYFQKQAALPNMLQYTLKIDVPQDFINPLSDFGIEVSFNPALKNVSITKFEPIKMIDWSDLQPADLFCVGGTGIASKIIKAGTWTFSSHTALYEGNNFIIESLFHGITRRSKDEFLSMSEGVNVIFVKRHRSSAGSWKDVVDAARDNVNYGIPPYGQNPMKYNWFALPEAGISSPTGKAIATAIPALGIAAGLNEVKDIARETVNMIPDLTEIAPGQASEIIKLNKTIWGGPKNRMFCTEAIIIWFNKAEIPITNMPPDRVPPKLVAENYFSDVLNEVGYLRYMP